MIISSPCRSIRATIALYCARLDLLGRLETLEAIGDFFRETCQTIRKLAEDFRLTTGLAS